MGKRGLVALLNLSSWCVVTVVWLFLAVPWGFLWFVIVISPDHTHYFRRLQSMTRAVQINLKQRINSTLNNEQVVISSKWIYKN